VRTLFFVFLSSLFFSINATGNKQFNSSRHHALGGASSSLIGTFSSLENLGTLGLQDSSIHVGLAFQNNFFLSSLNTGGLAVSHPLANGTIGLIYSRFGNFSFNENEIGLAYGKKIFKNTSGGVRLNYYRVQQDFFRSTGTVTVEFGIHTQIHKDIAFSAHIYNPFRSKLSEDENITIRTESGIRVGAIYKQEKFNLITELENNTNENLQLKGGLEIFLTPCFILRAGYNFPINEVSTGLGFQFSSFHIDLFYSFHESLGSSSGLGLGYAF